MSPARAVKHKAVTKQQMFRKIKGGTGRWMKTVEAEGEECAEDEGGDVCICGEHGFMYLARKVMFSPDSQITRMTRIRNSETIPLICSVECV